MQGLVVKILKTGDLAKRKSPDTTPGDFFFFQIQCSKWVVINRHFERIRKSIFLYGLRGFPREWGLDKVSGSIRGAIGRCTDDESVTLRGQ